MIAHDLDISKALSTVLTDREWFVVAERANGKTFAEIGASLGLTRAAAYVIYRDAMLRLRTRDVFERAKRALPDEDAPAPETYVDDRKSRTDTVMRWREHRLDTLRQKAQGRYAEKIVRKYLANRLPKS